MATPANATPANSTTTAGLVAQALSTPISAKIANRKRGVDPYRCRMDEEVKNEGRYVQIPVKDFMDRYFPAPPLDLIDHDVILDMEHFDIKDGDQKDEKKCYPIMVSKLEFD